MRGQWPLTIRSGWPVVKSHHWAHSTGRYFPLGVWNSDRRERPMCRSAVRFGIIAAPPAQRGHPRPPPSLRGALAPHPRVASPALRAIHLLAIRSLAGPAGTGRRFAPRGIRIATGFALAMTAEDRGDPSAPGVPWFRWGVLRNAGDGVPYGAVGRGDNPHKLCRNLYLVFIK